MLKKQLAPAFCISVNVKTSHEDTRNVKRSELNVNKPIRARISREKVSLCPQKLVLLHLETEHAIAADAK